MLLSWEGKLDSALVLLARARAADPRDVDTRLVQARVMAWNKQYADALLRYDSLLSERPDLREARLDRARALSWAGRLDEALDSYRALLAKDSIDRDARFGSAQVSGWKGNLTEAERQYRTILTRNSRDVEARVGLGYVYLWQGREGAAGRQAEYALAIDSTHKAGRELRRLARASTRPSVETAANWSNDSDDNTSYWQTLTASAPLAKGVSSFGSVNGLETSDPVRQATRVGGEAGLTVVLGRFRLTGAGGARRLTPGCCGPAHIRNLPRASRLPSGPCPGPEPRLFPLTFRRDRGTHRAKPRPRVSRRRPRPEAGPDADPLRRRRSDLAERWKPPYQWCGRRDPADSPAVLRRRVRANHELSAARHRLFFPRSLLGPRGKCRLQSRG